MATRKEVKHMDKQKEAATDEVTEVLVNKQGGVDEVNKLLKEGWVLQSADQYLEGGKFCGTFILKLRFQSKSDSSIGSASSK